MRISSSFSSVIHVNELSINPLASAIQFRRSRLRLCHSSLDFHQQTRPVAQIPPQALLPRHCNKGMAAFNIMDQITLPFVRLFVNEK